MFREELPEELVEELIEGPAEKTRDCNILTRILAGSRSSWPRAAHAYVASTQLLIFALLLFLFT